MSNDDMVQRIRGKLLNKLEGIADQMPDGLYTERKDGNEVFKLTDLVASYNNTMGKGPTVPESGVTLIFERGDQA